MPDLECPQLLAVVYEDWERGDYRQRFDVYADNFEWGFSQEFPEAHVGPDPELRSPRLRNWLSSWRDWFCFAEGFVEHADKVVVFTRYAGTAKTSGVKVEQSGAHVWTIEDDRALRLEIYADRKRALADVGIAPEDARSKALQAWRRAPDIRLSGRFAGPFRGG
jgi:ketosteroid isomerase-like protein